MERCRREVAGFVDTMASTSYFTDSFFILANNVKI